MNHRMKKRSLHFSLCAALLFCAAAVASDEVTTIQITDQILVKDTKRLGINLGKFGIKHLKKRIEFNFEGSLNRRAIFAGPLCTSNTITTFVIDDAWRDLINKQGATYRILNGPQKDKTGAIVSAKSLEKRARWEDKAEKKLAFYELALDSAIAPLNWRDGVMIEVNRTKEGRLPPGSKQFYRVKKPIFSKDTPPDSMGYNSLEIQSGKYQEFSFRIGNVPTDKPMATITGKIWLKGKEGSTSVNFYTGFTSKGTKLQTIQVSKDWKEYDLHFEFKPEGKGASLSLHADATVLADDIELTVEGYENDTPFSDQLVDFIEDVNPSIIRTLQMSGGDVLNYLQPIKKQYAVSKEIGAESQYMYSVNDYYSLCEKLNKEPWYCLPGTVTEEGILQYMEFIGAPADVGAAKIRADYGHPEPWTKTLKEIHVEFGNEIWNYAKPYSCCGYSGPDHWESIIATAKKSPYYTPNVIFHVAGRGATVGNPLKTSETAKQLTEWGSPIDFAPSADRFTRAPYIVHKFGKKDFSVLDTDEKLVQYAFGRALDNALNIAGGKGEMAGQQKKIASVGLNTPSSIYEINHHLCFTRRMNKEKETREEYAKDINTRERNVIMATLAGGVNVINAMLLHQKYNHTIDSCYFVMGGNFSVDRTFETSLYKWSSHYEAADGSYRYNPQTVGLKLVNQVMGGDLMETVHSGNKPVFSTVSYKKLKPLDAPLDSLWSFAYKNGDKRSLIVVNLDLLQSHKIKVEHRDGGKNAIQRVMTGESFLAHNMNEEQVTIVETPLETLPSGSLVEVPASSILTLEWN